MHAQVTSRCLIYARVSTKEQVSNLSLETQRERCVAFAASHGWLVDEVFVEEGESAKTVERTQLARLLAHCRSSRGRIQYVIVYSLSRLARNTQDHLALRALLAGMNIQLRSVTEPIEESSSGRLVETMLAAFAQHHNDVLSERVSAGMKAAIARGRWPYKAATGYRNARDGAGRPTLEPDPDRAPIVRQAFELAAAGAAPQEILEHVRVCGLTTPKGRAVGSKALAEMLRNPIYAGVLRVPAWAIEAPAAFEPLITSALFRRVQAVLGGKDAPHALRQRQNPDFPLKGFARHACGRPMVGYWATGRHARYGYYDCQACHVRARRDEFEDAFVEMLADARPSPETLKVFRLEVLNAWRVEERTAGENADGLMRRASALRERKERLAEGYVVERAMDRATYEALVARADEELQSVELRLAEAQGERLDAATLIDRGLRVIGSAGELWRAATPEERLAVQEFLYPDGVVWNGSAGFHRTAPRGFEMFEMGGAVVGDGGFGGPRVVQIEPWLRAAKRLSDVLRAA